MGSGFSFIYTMPLAIAERNQNDRLFIKTFGLLSTTTDASEQEH